MCYAHRLQREPRHTAPALSVSISLVYLTSVPGVQNIDGQFAIVRAADHVILTDAQTQKAGMSMHGFILFTFNHKKHLDN